MTSALFLRYRPLALHLVLAAVLLQTGTAGVAADNGTTATASSPTPATASSATVSSAVAPAVPVLSPSTVPATSAPADAAAKPIALPPSAIAPAAPRSMQTIPVATSSAATSAVASASSLTQVAMVLLLVVGLIAGIAWLLRRLGVARNAGGTTVRIVSGISLSNRERILVVEVADQWIVVGVAPGCINTLATMPRQESTAAPGPGIATPAGANFALWLKRTIDNRNARSNGGNSVSNSASNNGSNDGRANGN